jgi:hypothetical protein
MAFIRVAALSSLVALLSACAHEPAGSDAAVRADCGTVAAIGIYRSSDNELVDVNSVLGGYMGTIVGKRSSTERPTMSATMATGGGGVAVLGYQVEQEISGSRYRVMVLLDSGITLVVEDAHRPVELRVRDRVRVENNQVARL